MEIKKLALLSDQIKGKGESLSDEEQKKPNKYEKRELVKHQKPNQITINR